MSQVDVLDVLSGPERRNTTLLIEELILQSHGLIVVVSSTLHVLLFYDPPQGLHTISKLSKASFNALISIYDFTVLQSCIPESPHQRRHEPTRCTRAQGDHRRS